MKRIFLAATLVLSVLFILESCSPKVNGNASAPVKRGNVSGSWILSTITFENVPDVAIKSFLGENSYKCFIGSMWSLTNSGNGSYSLMNSELCSAHTQPIFWSMSAADETFQFKKINEGEKPKNVTDGYRLILSSANGESMIIKSPVEYGVTTAYVVLNFTRK